MKKLLLLIIILSVLSPELWAQRFRSGDNLARNSSWYAAIPKLQRQYRKTKDAAIAAKIADCYLNFANFDSAASWYSRMQPGILNDTTASKNYVRSLLALGNYGRARVLIQEYVKSYIPSNDAKLLMKSCEAPTQLPDNTALIFLDNAKSNSKNNDFYSVIHDGKLQYCSSRKQSGSYYDGDGKPFIKLFQVEDGTEEDWLHKSKEINIKHSTRYHLGPFAYVDNKKMLVTANGEKKQPAGRYTSDMALLNMYWAEPNSTSGRSYEITKPFEYNYEKFSTGHPAISPNGKYLFFVTDRPGTVGGTDLYLCTKDGDKWSEPSNMGPTVNTAGNEMFPTFCGDSVVYFSSNGRAGLGGLDIFKADFTNGTLLNITNVGKPFNSSRDDFGLTYTKRDEGYLTSNRKGGHGGDDIYHFKSNITRVHLIVINATRNKKVEGAKVRMAGDKEFYGEKTTDSAGHTLLEVMTTKPFTINATKEGLRPGHQKFKLDKSLKHDTTIYVYLYEGATSIISGYVMDDKRNVLDEALVQLTDSSNGDSQMAQTKPDGYFEFVVEPSKAIKLAGSKPGYFTNYRQVPTVKAGDNLKNQNLILLQVQLNRALNLEPIFYDYDKWDLRPESIEILEHVYQIMIENPTLMIECNSHTDMRGTNQYNDRLAHRRATVVREYLIERGIDYDRLTYNIHGEMKPPIPCATEQDCDEAKHQKNRSTRFVVLHY